MTTRRRSTVLLAALAMLFGTLVFSAGTANAVTCTSVAKNHFSYNAGSLGTYNVYKYRCSDGTWHATITGAGTTAGTKNAYCIRAMNGFDATGVTCYNVPGGYTPPRTSASTPTKVIGTYTDIVNICLYTSSTQFTELMCYDEAGRTS